MKKEILNSIALVTALYISYKIVIYLIINIDESLSYKDLAIAVSIILKDSYGKHNFNPFIKELKNHLNII